MVIKAGIPATQPLSPADQRKAERPRGVQVYPVPEEIGGPSIYGVYALLIRADGATRMVHTEGVAYLVTDDKPWTWSDYVTDLKAWSPSELISAVMTKQIQPVDLADWVRAFGDRLESNFYQAYRWTTDID